ncbi:MAG: 50S ribosomal protein L21 [Candidatus Moranbacteria bacterium]|nr:50S ribosomal protein L21 [Candidatus Moranbacteria bacterium]
MLAVIKTGGKQYIVKKGARIKIEKIEGKEEKAVKFSEVLFIGDEKGVKIGTPKVKGAIVEGKIIQQGRGKKVWGIKHNPKKRYKVKFGHRQPFTEVEIIKIA